MPTPFVDPSTLQPGDLVQCNDQEGEVMTVVRVGDRWSVKLSVKGVGTRTLLAPPSQFQRIETPLGRAQRGHFDTPEAFDLLTEATRLSLAYEHDRLVSLSNSRTKLEPFQVDAVHKIVIAWEQRFLIADDVGLGKTIEVGMVVKELKARHRADKVLVLCPAGLALQWQREMSERFDEHFDIITSSQLRQWRSSRPAGSPLSFKYPHAIVSIDTAKPREDENNAADFTEDQGRTRGSGTLFRTKTVPDPGPFCDPPSHRSDQPGTLVPGAEREFSSSAWPGCRREALRPTWSLGSLAEYPGPAHILRTGCAGRTTAAPELQ